jgi:hypothetical protein
MADNMPHLPGSKPGDWPEDFPHENGNYMCRCYRCKVMFYGHKRRVACKVCISGSAPAVGVQNTGGTSND